MKQLELPTALLLSILLMSCEKSSLGTIDEATDIPQLSNAVISPDSIYIDNLTPVNNLFAISTTVKVKMSLRSGNQTLTANVLQPTTLREVSRISLRDDGVAPDQFANDSIYSGKIDFGIQRSFAGVYRIRLSSITSEGLLGSVIEKSLKLARRNSKPILLSISAPDSIRLPATDTLRVQFSSVISDSDGLADIREMYFRRIEPPEPTKFLMKDDGGLDPPVFLGGPNGIPVRSGDDIAGDGKYSFLIPVTPTSTRRANIFEFQCIDSFGDTSRTIQRTFTIL